MATFFLNKTKYQQLTIILLIVIVSLLNSVSVNSQEPITVLNIGNAIRADFGQVSLNGRYVITLNSKLSKGTVLLWDTRIRKTIKSYATHNGIFNLMPGDTTLLILSEKFKLEIVHLFTKQVLYSFDIGSEVTLAEVSDDGKYIACSITKPSLLQKVFIIETEKKSIIWNCDVNNEVKLLKFKRNSSQLYICYKTGYQYNSGDNYPYSIKNLSCEKGLETTIGKLNITGSPLDISDNGKFILSCSNNLNQETFLYSTESANLIFKNNTKSTGFFLANNDYAYILHLNYVKSSKDYIYTPDDYFNAANAKSAPQRDENSYLTTIELTSGKAIKKEQFGLIYSYFQKPFISKNSKFIIMDGIELFDFHNKVHLFSAHQYQKNNKLIFDFSGNFSTIVDDFGHGIGRLPNANNAPDEPTIYFNHKDATIKYIFRKPSLNIIVTSDSRYFYTQNYSDNKLIFTKKDFLTGLELEQYIFESNIFANRISPNGKILYLTNYPYNIFYDLDKRTIITKFKHKSLSANFSTCGNYISLKDGDNNTITVFNFNTGLPENFNYKKKIERISFSQNDEFAVIKEKEKSNLTIVNTYTKKIVATFNLAVPDYYPMQVSNNGLFLIAKSSIYNTKTNSVIKENITVLDFTPDNKYVYDIPYGMQTINFYDIENHFITNSDSISGNEIKFIPNTTNYISLSNKGGIKIKNYVNKSDLTLYLSTNSKDWIMITNDGFWDSSVEGSELISMVKGAKAWNIDQFAIKNNRPDIILQRLGCENIELVQHYKNQFNKRLRKAGIKEESLNKDYQLPTAIIKSVYQNEQQLLLNFSFSDNTSLSRYNVFINNVPLFGSYGKNISGKIVNVNESVQLNTGLNKIEVSCFNTKGIESLREVYYAKNEDKPAQNLYLLAFGISQYHNPSYNLQYAHKDALDLEKVIQNMKGKGFENVYTKVLTNEQVTPEAIKASKDFVKYAKPDDTFILFIAGHGMHDTDSEATYYYLTSNADINNLKGTAADFETIEDLLQGIPPRNKLFLMDACESGEIDVEDQGQMIAAATGAGIASRGFKSTTSQSLNQPISQSLKRSYLYQKDRYIYNDLVRRSGAIVFSSSKGGELSYERSDIENGLFTEYIMKALTTTEADKDGNGTISTDELRVYVSEQVAKASGDLQHPTVDRDNIYQKFGFGIK